MKIDIHNHTAYSSPCSILQASELIQKAREMGLDAICVTEHNTMEGAFIAREIAARFDFLVLAGQEVRTQQGDVLCFGIYDEDLADIDCRDLAELAAKRGGALIPAHPYRLGALALGDRIFDYPQAWVALECLNGNCNSREMQKAFDAADKLALPCAGGSDAHSLPMIGRYYTEFPVTISNEQEMVAALRSGEYTARKNPRFKARALFEY